MDSFNGVATFQVLDGSHDRTGPYTYTVQPIPGSNTFWFDLGGQAGVQRKLILLFSNDTDYFNFAAMRGQVGTLVCFDFNGPALLLDVHRTFRNPPGSATEAECLFLEL